MARPKLSKYQRQLQALTARRMVEEELAATPAPLLTEAHTRVALRLGVTTRTLRTRLAEAPAIPTSKECEAVLQAYKSKWPTGKKLVAADQCDGVAAAEQVWDEIDTLIDMLKRRSNWMRDALIEID